MKILATSDMHGKLPAKIPECDLLLIAGDVCPVWNHDRIFQLYWLDGAFRKWLEHAHESAKAIIGIAGNHDFIFESRPLIDGLHLPWVYLQDETTTHDGLVIHGIPWVPNLPSWAFHANAEKLGQMYDKIPKGTDIVLSHGPPRGYGDQPARLHPGEYHHIGSRAATNMLARVKPKAFVCGHIHECYGLYRHEGRNHHTDIYLVSYLDRNYQVRESIRDTLVEIDLDASDVLMTDAIEDQTDIERQVRDPDSDTRSSSESPTGS